MEAEPLKEEKAKLEQDLRRSVRELGEILFQNDELIKENKDKDSLSDRRQLYLVELKEKNAAELLQYIIDLLLKNLVFTFHLDKAITKMTHAQVTRFFNF